MITVAIPNKIMMTLDFRARPEGSEPGPFDAHWGARVVIEEGPREVPKLFAEHWWLKAHGCKPWTPPRVEGTFTEAERDAYARAEVAKALAARDLREGKPPAAAAKK
jgi:hypothetical protein